MFWLLLFIVPVGAYNTTHSILHQTEQLCKHQHMTCTYHDEILVVDWNIHKPRNIVWNFNEHARELITGELALHMLYQLIEFNPSERITIIPVLNVWGRTKAFHRPCQRKNKNGIDINRNFWYNGNHKKYSKHSEEYQGYKSISEKESILLAKIIKDAKRYINIHSGEFSIYMPYDGSYERPDNYHVMNKNIHTYAKYCPQCQVGQAARTSLYRAFGTSVDWAIHQGVPEAYTFEIYGKNSFNCKEMFNPKETEPILKQWEKILKLTIN